MKRTTATGETLSNMIDSGFFIGKDFTYICDCILKILAALVPVHAKGYLHLGVSPDNIHVEHLGHARFMDSSSTFQIGVRSAAQSWVPSLRLGYSANELVAYSITKPTSLSHATDLYSVTAIFFKLLVGKAPTDEVVVSPSKWQLSNKTGYLAGEQNLLVKKTNGVLLKGLAISPHRRYQSIADMKAAIEELENLAK